VVAAWREADGAEELGDAFRTLRGGDPARRERELDEELLEAGGKAP
jgi:hypothetical protein